MNCNLQMMMLFVAELKVKAQEELHLFIKISSAYGLNVSYEKTKIMSFGPTLSLENTADMMCFAGTMQHIDRCKYLASTVSADMSLTSEITETLSNACKCFGALRKPIFNVHKSVAKLII